VANVYYYEVAGLDPLKQVSISAETEKQANKKISNSKIDGRKLSDWKLVKVEKEYK
jgi:hypothetical protein